MNKTIAVILLGLIPLSGCSSPEPSYDPVELMEYELCLNTPVGEFANSWTPVIAEAECESRKPVPK